MALPKLASFCFAIGFGWTAVADASSFQLAPFKDDLFAYPAGTVRGDDGRETDVAYSEARDINDRDEIPERRVKMDYVDPTPLRSQSEVTLDTSAGALKTIQVGEKEHPSAVVLFIHGRNGDRRLGMYDRTFGGNFNRLKNLMARAGGLYVTADAGSFAEADKRRIGDLIVTLSNKPGRPPLVLACASMGGEFCWDVLGWPGIASNVAGVVMLSANNVPAKVKAVREMAGKRALPLVIAHGTRDKVFGWQAAHDLYETLRLSDYPVRFVSMNDGNHGTPIRMIDWREALNGLFAQAR